MTNENKALTQKPPETAKKKLPASERFAQKVISEFYGSLIKYIDIMPLCNALGVSPNELFGYEEPESAKTGFIQSSKKISHIQ